MDIQLKNIHFSYNGIPVLKDLTLDFPSGMMHAIVGPNGSGKSTLLKCLDRILVPKGSIYLDHNPSHTFSSQALARKLAYVPQSNTNGLNTEVYNTVLLGRKPHFSWRPGPKDHKITEQVLEDFGLSHLAMKTVNHLSGGEQQRVSIARAMAQEPEVLLLDEPTSSLDLKYQSEIMDILRRLVQKNTTVILAIHDLNLAMRYAHRFYFLKDGRLLAQGGQEVIHEVLLETLYEMKIEQVATPRGNIWIPERT